MMIPMAMTSGTSERLDLRREVEIEVGQAVGGVRGESDADALPADVDVGMVIGLLGEEAHSHDERDRAGKVAAVELLDDLVALARPAGQRFERRRDLGVGEGGHCSIEPETRRRGTLGTCPASPTSPKRRRPSK